MRTLYLRNVPDDVIQRLERLAERSRMSVTAVAIQELANSTRRVDNAALLADGPNLDIDMETIVRALREGREER